MLGRILPARLIDQKGLSDDGFELIDLDDKRELLVKPVHSDPFCRDSRRLLQDQQGSIVLIPNHGDLWLLWIISHEQILSACHVSKLVGESAHAKTLLVEAGEEFAIGLVRIRDVSEIPSIGTFHHRALNAA